MNTLALLVIRALLRPQPLRGTAVAIGAITMNNGTNLMTRVESKPILGSDWVDAHADYLFNFAIGQVRDVSVAEDLVQDTFLAAVKAQNTFGGKSSERTWLVGILRHKIYAQYATIQRR